MGIKDTTAKNYMSDNNRFADLFNFRIFGGRQVIEAGNLVERDSTEIISFFDEENFGRSIKLQRWRDLLKMATIKSNEEAIYVILGIENQSDVHYAMTVRNMLYDAISYAKQVEGIVSNHRKKKDTKTSSEFLSGFAKEDKLKPVITLTIYWGTDTWDAPRTLHDMLSTNNADVLKYVNDYKLNLVVPGEITEFSVFQSELGKLLEVFKSARDENTMNTLFKRDAYKSVSIEAVDMMNTFLGLEIPKSTVDEGGQINMCKAWDDHFNSGRKMGIEQGIEQGIAQGRIDAIQRMLKGKFSREQILGLGYDEHEYEEAEKSILTLA